MQVDLTPKIQKPARFGLSIGLPFIYHHDPLTEKLVGRGVPPTWAISLANQVWPMNMMRYYIPLEGVGIALGRQMIAERAVAENSEFLWMLDDDTTPPLNAVRHMIAALQQNSEAMVCIAPTPTKSDPIESNIYKYRNAGCYWDWKSDDVFEIAEGGAACMMVRTEVFEKLEKPWFNFSENKEEEMIERTVGEDIYFCRKVVDAGYKILAHGRCATWHWDNLTGECYKFPDRYYNSKR